MTLDVGKKHMLDQVAQTFSDCIETIAQNVDHLPKEMVEAANVIVKALVNEKKVLVCGVGVGAEDARSFSLKLLNRHAEDRPTLPVICLSADSSTLTHDQESCENVFFRQIRALALADDVLFVITDDHCSSYIINAIKAAHFCEMSVIVLTDNHQDRTAYLLNSDDIHIKIIAKNSVRAQEVQRLVLNCLCELIDEHLFGI